MLRTYHRTSSIVATASSTEECPTVPSPDWIDLPRCSRTLPEIIEHCGYYEMVDQQITERPPVRWTGPMWKQNRGINTVEMDYPERFEVIFKGMANEYCFRINERIQRLSNG